MMYKLNEIPSYEALLRLTLDKIPDTYDKRGGSVIFNAVAPICMELSYLYLKLRTYTDLVFIDTAVGSYLDRLVLQNGIERTPATYAEKYGKFNLPGLEGQIFLKDDVKFEVIEQVRMESTEIYWYRLRCTEEGTIGNVTDGTLTSLNHITNLTLAELQGTIHEGADIETDDHLRQRYIDNVTDIPFGGNQADYRTDIKKMDGVGSCKVIPVWEGPGTVKCIITDAEYGQPTPFLVDQVQQAVDPTKDGYGIGTAPIGHIVTVTGARNAEININAQISTKNAPLDLQVQMETAIKRYFQTLNANWESLNNVTVRVSQLTNVLLDVDGIIDVGEVTINDEAKNLALEPEELAYLTKLTTEEI